MLNKEKEVWSVTDKRQYLLTQATGVLWQYFKPFSKVNPNSTIPPIDKISKQDLLKVVETRFLISDKLGEFMSDVAPKIISSIKRNVKVYEETEIGRIAGKVLWNKTIIKRSMSGGDENLFVFQRKFNDYDSAVNRLFYYVIRLINSIATKYVANNDEAKTPTFAMDKLEIFEDIVFSVFTKTRDYIKRLANCHIPEVDEIDDSAIDECETNKMNCYKELGEFARLLILFQQDPLDFLRSQIDFKILSPKSDEDLLDIAIIAKLTNLYVENGYDYAFDGLIDNLQGKIVTIKGMLAVDIYYKQPLNSFSIGNQFEEAAEKLFNKSAISIPPRIIIKRRNGLDLIYTMTSDNKDEILKRIRYIMSEIENYRKNTVPRKYFFIVFTDCMNVDALQLNDNLQIVELRNLNCETMQHLFPFNIKKV